MNKKAKLEIKFEFVQDKQMNVEILKENNFLKT